METVLLLSRARRSLGALVALGALVPSTAGCGSGEVDCASPTAAGAGVVVCDRAAISGRPSAHLVGRLCIDGVCASRPISRDPHVVAMRVKHGFDLSQESLTVRFVITTGSGDVLFDGTVAATGQAPNPCRDYWVLGLRARSDGTLALVRL